MNWWASLSKFLELVANQNQSNTSAVEEIKDPSGYLGWEKVKVDKVGNGYGYFSLRAGVIANDFRRFVLNAHALGVLVSSSGGKRTPWAKVTKGRASISLHHLGRAIDLRVYGGAFWGKGCEYIVERDGERHWSVYFQSDLGEPDTVFEYDHGLRESRPIEGSFVNVTKLLASHDFERIGKRGNAYSQLEWWHFQNTKGLIVGVTTLKEELLKVWPDNAKLRKSPLWAYRDYVWNGSVFKKTRLNNA